MKCSLCNSDLIPGNNICPKCGALNMSFEQQSNNTPTTQAVEMPQVVQNEVATPVEMPQAGVVQAAEENVETLEENKIADFEDLDAGEEEKINVTENMAAPTLEVQNEDLQSGVKDISSQAEVATYDPTQEVQEEGENREIVKDNTPDFQIPEVKEGEKDTQGMAIPEVKTNENTVGVEEAPKKFKFDLKIIKSKTLPRNFVIVLVVIFLIIGILIGSTMFNKQVYTPGGSSNKVIKEEKIPHVSDGKNNVTYINSFEYKIPEGFTYDKSNGGVIIYSPEDSFRSFIKGTSGSYEHIVNSKTSIKSSLEGAGYTVNSITERKISERNYLMIEISTGMTNRTILITGYDDSNIFYVEIITSENNLTDASLDATNDIISNATKVDMKNKLESIEANDLSKFIATIGEANNS